MACGKGTIPTDLSSSLGPPSHSRWLLTIRLGAVWGGKKLSQGLLGLQDSCGQKRDREMGGWGCGARRKRGVGWGLRLLKVRATFRREREHSRPPRGASVPGREGDAPISSHIQNPSFFASSRPPKSFMQGPRASQLFPKWEAARAAPSLR